MSKLLGGNPVTISVAPRIVPFYQKRGGEMKTKKLEDTSNTHTHFVHKGSGSPSNTFSFSYHSEQSLESVPQAVPFPLPFAIAVLIFVVPTFQAPGPVDPGLIV